MDISFENFMGTPNENWTEDPKKLTQQFGVAAKRRLIPYLDGELPRPNKF
jgi:hypothetical protein